MNENATTADVLRKAKEVLWEKGWHQGRMEGPNDERCAMGACYGSEVCAKNWEREAWEALEAVLPPGPWIGSEKLHPVAAFNDHPDTTFDDVLDLFDAAIKRCEEAEAGDQ